MLIVYMVKVRFDYFMLWLKSFGCSIGMWDIFMVD